MNRLNGRGLNVRQSKDQKHKIYSGHHENQSDRPSVFINIPLYLSFNNSLLSTSYVPDIFLGTRNTAVNKIDNASPLMKLIF